MLHTKTGSISRIVLACFIGVAFVFALAWPQYAKRRNAVHAHKAGEFAQTLAAAEETYKQQTGAYTPDFRKLNVPLDCPVLQTADGPVLDCEEYVYSLQDNLIRAEHKQLQMWLHVSIPQGEVSCHYPDQDWAGTDLCRRLERI